MSSREEPPAPARGFFRVTPTRYRNPRIHQPPTPTPNELASHPVRTAWHHFQHAWGNGQRWRILGGALAASAAWATAAIWWAATTSQPSPFGDYPIQTVEAPAVEVDVHREGPTSATVVLPKIAVADKAVVVSGTKCIAANEPVGVHGTVVWRMTEPHVEVVEADSGSAVRDPGCRTFRWVNPIPPRVAGVVGEVGVSVWQITGTETADSGHSRTWQTESFAVVP